MNQKYIEALVHLKNRSVSKKDANRTHKSRLLSSAHLMKILSFRTEVWKYFDRCAFIIERISVWKKLFL